MDRARWFEAKWKWLKRFALAALIGAGLLGVGALFEVAALLFVGALTVVPLFFWLAFIPVLHWKDRYIGSSVNVWGAFLVFETSGWSKVYYWFKHVLPDWRRTGTYADAP